MDKIKSNASAYRWVVLSLLTLSMMTLNILQFQISGLANRLNPALHLSPGQFAMILSAPMLSTAVLAIPAGILADYFGVKKVIIFGLAVASVSSFFRIDADHFSAMFLSMLFMGFGLAFINGNGAKLLSGWFPPGQMRSAMGIFIAGTSAGIAIAQATSSLFPSIRLAFTVSALLMTIVLMLWIVLAKSQPKQYRTTEKISIIAYLKVACKSKSVYLAALAMFCFMGAWVAESGNLPNALIENKHITPLTAGIAASVLNVAFIIGSLTGPLLSDKAGRIRPFLIPTALLASIACVFMFLVPFGTVSIFLFIINGFLLGAAVPVMMSIPVLLPEIGPVYAGSAGGIISMFQMTGAFLVPSYVIALFALKNVEIMFVIMGCGYFLFGFLTIFLPEVGRIQSKAS